MTQLLADENIPKESLDFLKRQGVDIVAVTEFSSGLSDREILELAKTDGRIVVTFDKDFGQIIFREGFKANGLIMLRFIPKSPQQTAKRVQQLLASKIVLEKRVVTLKEDGVKVTSIR